MGGDENVRDEGGVGRQVGKVCICKGKEEAERVKKDKQVERL